MSNNNQKPKKHPKKNILLKILGLIGSILVAIFATSFITNKSGNTINNTQTINNSLENFGNTSVNYHKNITYNNLDQEKFSPQQYDAKYVQTQEGLIKSNDNLEGFLIVYTRDMTEPASFETVFGNEKVKISLGLDYPIGYKIKVYFYDNDIEVPLFMDSDSVVDDYGDFYENTIIQISPYDFDKDGINELIICAGDGLVCGACDIYSYTYVEDKTKLNPFNLELREEIQADIKIEENKLYIQLGTSMPIDEYKYVDKEFYVPYYRVGFRN